MKTENSDIDLSNVSLIENQFQDHYFNVINGGSFNQIGAKALYDEFFHGSLCHAKTLYIIIGTDCGLLPQYLVDHIDMQDAHYLFVEYPAVVKRLVDCGKALPQHPQISYYQPDTWQAACQKPPLVYYLYHKQCEVIQSMAVLDGHCPTYQHLRYQIERQSQHLQWAIHGQLVGEFFCAQQMLNIAENQVPAKIFRGQFNGATAVLLAGGPSLDCSLDWIKQNREKLLVVAVSRIAKRLLDVDLIPDMVVAIDPTEKMFAVSQEMLQFPDSVMFVNADHVTSHLLHAWPHRRVYLGLRYPWDDKNDIDNVPPQGPTVTNAALSLLISMGVQRVLLTGADLCYSQEGYTHAKGSREYQQGPMLGFLGQQVTCYNGAVADTDPAFFQATQALAEQAEIAINAGVSLINLSPTAAAIPGIAYLPSDEIVLASASLPVQAIFDSVYPKMTAQWFQQDYQHCATQLKMARKQIHGCAQLIKQCRQANKKSSANATQFTKLEAKLNKTYAPWLGMLKKFHLQQFQQFFGQVQQDFSNYEQVQQATEGYLAAYASSCEVIQQTIEQASQHLQSRLDEMRGPANFAELRKQWRTLAQPRQAEQATAASTPSGAELSLEAFKKIQSKCLYLFRSQDAENCQALLKRLSHYQSDGGLALVALCAGYLSELLEEADEAVNFYYQAAEYPLSRELALNHLTSLLIRCHDNDNALLALSCLCQISKGYCPSYAKLLAETGQTESACAVLERYLAESPDDSLAQATLQQLRKSH